MRSVQGTCPGSAARAIEVVGPALRCSRIDCAGDPCEGSGYARAEREPYQFAWLADDFHFACPLTVHTVGQLYGVAVAKQFQTDAELFRLFPKSEEVSNSLALRGRLAANCGRSPSFSRAVTHTPKGIKRE